MKSAICFSKLFCGAILEYKPSTNVPKQCPLCLKHYDQSQQKNNKKQQHYDQLLRKRTKYVHFDKAIDVLLQSPATINCNDNNSLLYFLPN